MRPPTQLQSLISRVYDKGVLVGYPELAGSKQYLVLIGNKLVRSCNVVFDEHAHSRDAQSLPHAPPAHVHTVPFPATGSNSPAQTQPDVLDAIAPLETVVNGVLHATPGYDTTRPAELTLPLQYNPTYEHARDKPAGDVLQLVDNPADEHVPDLVGNDMHNAQVNEHAHAPEPVQTNLNRARRECDPNWMQSRIPGFGMRATTKPNPSWHI